MVKINHLQCDPYPTTLEHCILTPEELTKVLFCLNGTEELTKVVFYLYGGGGAAVGVHHRGRRAAVGITGETIRRVTAAVYNHGRIVG